MQTKLTSRSGKQAPWYLSFRSMPHRNLPVRTAHNLEKIWAHFVNSFQTLHHHMRHAITNQKIHCLDAMPIAPASFDTQSRTDFRLYEQVYFFELTKAKRSEWKLSQRQVQETGYEVHVPFICVHVKQFACLDCT